MTDGPMNIVNRLSARDRAMDEHWDSRLDGTNCLPVFEHFVPETEEDEPPNFECPVCASHRLEEVLQDVTYATEIHKVYPNGDIDYADKPTAEGGTIARYQCYDCGWPLPCEPDPMDLVRYLANPEKKS